MAKPLVAIETIYDTALHLLDSGGPDSLSARNLATALGCSTRTIYQQVGKREDLVRQLLDYHFNRVHLEFDSDARWQDSATTWASAMRRIFLSNPNLSRLLSIGNRPAIANYVNQLLVVFLHSGFDEELALRSCRVLAHTVISLGLAEIDTPPVPQRRKRRGQREIQLEDLVIQRSCRNRNNREFQDNPEVFDNTVRWIIVGIEAELAAS